LSMPVDPRTPVLVGVGQVVHHPTPNATYDTQPHPLDLMVEALECASRDAGNERRVLESVDEIVAVGSFSWHTNDPALLVAQRLALSDVTTRLTATGGNTPQQLVHESARRILAGDVTTVAVVGAEAMHARALARREGRTVDWLMQSDDVAKPLLGEEVRIPLTADEYAQGLTLPAEVYPLFENARRARHQWSLETQRERLGTLWENFARVAQSNPHAWLRSAPTANEIATPSTSNRIIAFPYTKFLVANLPVDMGAAYVITSYENALAQGVARDAMVFPQFGADANDHWFVSERPALDDSPAMRAIWDALRDFGVRESELSRIDLYSCFPTVVQTACDVLGIDAFDPSRVPTLTGGLTFAGGPGNNYVTHAVASVVEALRNDQHGQGLVTGLGWFSTKHSWGTYATSPPTGGFQWRDVQREVDAQPKCAYKALDGEVVIESYTVRHDRSDDPQRLVVAARNPRGVRTWCHSTDVELMKRAESEEIIDTSGVVKDGLLTT